VVWFLSVSTDAVVRLMGGEPGSTREHVDLEELREMVTATKVVSSDHQEVLVGAFEVADRTLREVLVPRPDVFSLRADARPSEALTSLLDAGFSRAPVIPGTELDEAVGVVHLRDLVTAPADSTVGDLAQPAEALPESVPVLAGMRTMQERRQHLALVVDEFGGIDGIVTLEDLLEELVGEIYDEVDRDIGSVSEESEGSVVVEGRFPVHDLTDIGIDVPAGDYTTVAGLILDQLGHLPGGPGERVVVGDWEITVLSVRGRSIRRVRFSRRPD
jgi:putative hemolysin